MKLFFHVFLSFEAFEYTYAPRPQGFFLPTVHTQLLQQAVICVNRASGPSVDRLSLVRRTSQGPQLCPGCCGVFGVRNASNSHFIGVMRRLDCCRSQALKVRIRALSPVQRLRGRSGTSLFRDRGSKRCAWEGISERNFACLVYEHFGRHCSFRMYTCIGHEVTS